jgi:hypothetical protein
MAPKDGAFEIAITAFADELKKQTYALEPINFSSAGSIKGLMPHQAM